MNELAAVRTAAETLKTTGTMCAAAHIVIYQDWPLQHAPTLREFSCEIRLAGRDGDELDINKRATTTYLAHADMNVLASKARRHRGGASIGTLP